MNQFDIHLFHSINLTNHISNQSFQVNKLHYRITCMLLLVAVLMVTCTEWISGTGIGTGTGTDSTGTCMLLLVAVLMVIDR